MQEPCAASDRAGTSAAAAVCRTGLSACRLYKNGPVYLDGAGNRAETSAAILALQIKRLISVDFALPLQGFDYAGYEPWPIHGSMALTAAGQEALDSLDIQGCGA